MYRDETYHKECFICHKCNCLLVNEKFTVKDDRTYCTKCYGEMFAVRCDACKNPLIGWSQLISFMLIALILIIKIQAQ